MNTTPPEARADLRAGAVAETMAAVRAAGAVYGDTREALERVKVALLQLAEMKNLFTVEDFPLPDDPELNSCLYRLSEDQDHRHALYLNVARAGVDAPPHNHTTWAVIVGIQGEELNRFYQKAEPGVSQTGEFTVAPGTGVTFLADDLHSIHIHGEAPVINFHCYGLALEQLHERQYWSDKHQEWRIFPPHQDIREARRGH